MKRIFQASIPAVVAFLLLIAGMPASSALAGEPPWPAGIPWPTTVAWPTAHPLQIGVPWSPSIQTYPNQVAPPMPAPLSAPLPPVVSSVIVPAATPLPPISLSAPIVPAPVPPVAPNSNSPSLVGTANSMGGTSRFDALVPGDSWRALGAGASAWFRIGTGGMHMDVWLDADPHSGVGMAIYAPDGSNKPVGQGTPDRSDPARLSWSGGHWNGDGDWYALISNGNPFAVQYRVTSAQQDISNKTCWSYWEYIGPNQVYWTKCSN